MPHRSAQHRDNERKKYENFDFELPHNQENVCFCSSAYPYSLLVAVTQLNNHQWPVHNNDHTAVAFIVSLLPSSSSGTPHTSFAFEKRSFFSYFYSVCTLLTLTGIFLFCFRSNFFVTDSRKHSRTRWKYAYCHNWSLNIYSTVKSIDTFGWPNCERVMRLHRFRLPFLFRVWMHFHRSWTFSYLIFFVDIFDD